jgi:hypothetical protein
MITKVSTQPAGMLFIMRRWLDNALARWTERVDSTPMPTQHRMGSWERSLRDTPRE